MFSSPLSFVHLASKKRHPELWTKTFLQALGSLGTLRIVEEADALSEGERAALIRDIDVLFTGWGAVAIPLELIHQPGRLRYICHLTGGMKGTIPLEFIQAGVPVTNWGDSPAYSVAEGALALLLAMLKNLRGHIEEKRSGIWEGNSTGAALRSGSVRGLRVGLYGMGVISRQFASMLRPLGAQLHAYDPYASQWPEGVRRVDSLAGLFSQADVVSIHAGVNPSTVGSVTADLLGLLPEGGILINTARGEIVDQQALFASLASGRLRAGLDVLCGDDRLPRGHPAPHWPNVIFTGHAASVNYWPHSPTSPDSPLQPLHDVALDNLARFARGEPLRFRITEEQYKLMT